MRTRRTSIYILLFVSTLSFFFSSKEIFAANIGADVEQNTAGLQWDKSTLGSANSPALTVAIGGSFTHTVKATANASISLTCFNCNKATFQDKGNGVGMITWDTTGEGDDIYLFELTATAEGFSINGTLYIQLGSGTPIDCTTKKSESDCSKTSTCVWFDSTNSCKGAGQLTEEEKTELQKLKTKALLDAYAEQYKMPENYTGPLPECAFKGNCDDINDVLELAIKVAKWLFGIIGTIALCVFIYGGFTLIISFGNPDKVKKGQKALVSAVIGIIIAFSAYVGVKFILEAFQVSEFFTVPFQQ